MRYLQLISINYFIILPNKIIKQVAKIIRNKVAQ